MIKNIGAKDSVKEEVISIIAKHISLEREEIDKLLEIPPTIELGDYAFPCFSLAKQLKKSPIDIATELAREMKENENSKVIDVKADGSYLNFFLNKEWLVETIVKEILNEKDKFGKKEIESKSKKRKIMVEFPSPNTNKPLHLGHLRNMAIGESASRILEALGDKVIRANLYNDRGVHVCKSMVAYKDFGKNDSPEKSGVKSDHLVGDYYVMFNRKAKETPQLEEDALEMLRKWEAGDKKTLELWKKMNSWALEGIKETFKLFGIKSDKEYYESKIYKDAQKIVDMGLKKGLFKQNKDGAIVINLKLEGLGEKVIVRADGTSIYITQDLYLAKLKDDEFNLDGSIYVVGNEQNYHFQVLFSILKKLGFKFSNNLHHLSYGMVELPEGRLKSREGNTVDADDLILETQKLAKEELNRRGKLNKKELDARSLEIARAAIKYTLLKSDILKNMIFNPNEAISFEGDTGPYLLYSYARASSIMRNAAKEKKKRKLKNERVFPEYHEIVLLRKMHEFPEIVEKAYEKLSPNLIANYSFELAKLFNEFYQEHRVLGSENEAARVKIVEAFRIVLKSALYLLGIETIEEM